MKQCKKCGLSRESGAYCQPCRKIYLAQQYILTKSVADARHSAWAKLHPDRINAASKTWRSRNVEKYCTIQAAYRGKNKEKLKAYKIAWCQKNPDRTKATMAKASAGKRAAKRNAKPS